MSTMWLFFALTGAVIWAVIWVLPWRPWGIRESLDAEGAVSPENMENITALIPARNERETIPYTLKGLESQGRGIRIILVDDQSEDGTADYAKQAMGGRIQVLEGRPLPRGWSGKLWALEQGRPYVKTPLMLLIDADIELRPGIIACLRALMAERECAFVSLMADLRMVGFWERLLMPAFIYFFKMLYPFHLSNKPSSRVAAAAGGCILLKTELMDEIGGFGALRDELIDDCSLARKVKRRGYRTWIGLTHSVRSLRPYSQLGTIWDMVARTAYTQLHYSFTLLLLCSALLIATFCLPIITLILGAGPAKWLSAITLVAMILSYMPTVRYYGLPLWWVPALPFASFLYLCMTWTSAFRYWGGKRSQWKGRVYERA